MTAPVRLFIFGLGYSAGALARAIHSEAAWVGGTVRGVDKAVALGAAGTHAFLFDGTAPGIGVGAAVRHATHLLISIAPGQSDPVLAHHRQTLAAAPHLRWIGYLSTVGVYGDQGGAWVDETAPPSPGSLRSRQRLVAEEAWQAAAEQTETALAIFRLAGIYGPGRNALAKLADGKARRIVKPDQVFNRIHVDDIVAILQAAIAQEATGVFNLADHEPAPPQDVVAHAAGLMNIEPPPEVTFEKADLTAIARSFYGENKRIANTRITRDLGVRLRYPTYREALVAMWQTGEWRTKTVT
jgi:nucleoside-diphosphate-sugar epimerase